MKSSLLNPLHHVLAWSRLLGRPALAACAASLALAAPAQAAWPDRPVTIIVPFASGGGSDITARLIAKELGESLHQSFIVENKPGASTQIATRHVINSAPDGNTLLLGTISLINNPVLYKNLNYDAAKGLRSVINLVDVPDFLLVTSSLGASTAKEFLAKAKTLSDANKLNFGSAGTASSLHLAGEWLNQAAHLKGSHIPYKGSGPAMVALAGGDVSYSIENLGPALSSVQSGRVKMLAVLGPKRYPTLPDVPTLHEATGMPDTDMASWFVLMAPAATPDSVVNLLNQKINTILAKPEIRKQLLELGEIAVGGSPKDLSDRMKADGAKWIKVIEDGKVKIDE